MSIHTQTSVVESPSCSDLCRFLSAYAAKLLSSGATCLRLEKNIGRISESYGITTEITITPRHVSISVVSADGNECMTMISSVKSGPVSFNVISELSRLSWKIADCLLPFNEIKEEYEKIISGDVQRKGMTLLLVSLANASFCRLFGGDVMAMLIAGLATFSGFYLKQILSQRGLDLRMVVVISSFLSTVIGASDTLFSIGSTPDVTIGTSILYLVPGVSYLNSFSDMFNRYYICSMSRLLDALIITASLSIGLCLGMLLMGMGMF